jgi:phospholipase C
MLVRQVRRLAVAAALIIVAAVAALAGSALADSPGSAHAPAVNATTPCVGLSGAPSRITHVIVLFMENHPYDDIIGSPDAPYANGLAQRCGLATNYHNITHPSAPEYIAATSGELGGAGDCPPVALAGWPAPCPDANDNIFNQTLAAGETWKVYQESMASNCLEADDGSTYDINHNPAAYYSDLGGPAGIPGSPCALYDVPMGTPQSGNLETDLANGTLANYSFIAPNTVNDTHDDQPGEVAVGDAYLAQLIPTILNSPEYENGSTVLFLVWDEGEHGHTNDCAYNTTDIGCHVPTIVMSPYVQPGTQSDELFNHYSLFKTSEQLLGLPFIGHATDPTVKSLAPAFHL